MRWSWRVGVRVNQLPIGAEIRRAHESDALLRWRALMPQVAAGSNDNVGERGRLINDLPAPLQPAKAGVTADRH